uniref:AC4 n=1 Tax=Sweet potato leaf curl Sichuan virus 2 TaxID=2026195 RepID=A0A1B1PIF5_9GEMI|nr:AC4 [Sweet potato leaf curl Sichuan virus 2]
MGNLTSTCLCSSRGNSGARIKDSSIWCHQQGQPIFTPTSRELNPAPTSSPTSRRTGIHSPGVSSRSTADLLEAVSRRLMTPTLRH